MIDFDEAQDAYHIQLLKVSGHVLFTTTAELRKMDGQHA